MLKRRTYIKRFRVKPRRKGERVPKSAVKVFPDGREVCSKTAAGEREYNRRRSEMYDRDGGICCVCLKYIVKGEETFEHHDGRGIGGSKRDDRIVRDGKPYNGVAHGLCNSSKGSVSLDKWREKGIENGK